MEDDDGDGGRVKEERNPLLEENIEDKKYLLQAAKAKNRHAWVGIHPPFNMDAIDLLGSTNCRVSPVLHHLYQTVWVYEQIDCVEPEVAKLLLEEAIGLLGTTGRLIVRVPWKARIQASEVQDYLTQKIDIRCAIDREIRYDRGDSCVLVFDITRESEGKYVSDTWSMAVLTEGNREEQVVEFLRSVRDAEEDGRKSELIVCGQENKQYAAYNIHYMDKKALFSGQVQNDNLLIVWCECALPQNFFKAFSAYGYDFGMAALRCAQPEHIGNIDMQIANELLIVKSHLLRKLHCGVGENCMTFERFAEILMENQMIPRLNFFVNVLNTEREANVKSDFLSFQNMNANPCREDRDEKSYGQQRAIIRRIRKVANYFPRSLKKNRIYRKMADRIAIG